MGGASVTRDVPIPVKGGAEIPPNPPGRPSIGLKLQFKVQIHYASLRPGAPGPASAHRPDGPARRRGVTRRAQLTVRDPPGPRDPTRIHSFSVALTSSSLITRQRFRSSGAVPCEEHCSSPRNGLQQGQIIRWIAVMTYLLKRRAFSTAFQGWRGGPTVWGKGTASESSSTAKMRGAANPAQHLPSTNTWHRRCTRPSTNHAQERASGGQRRRTAAALAIR